MRNLFTILLLAILISGCEGCVSKFYKVHEKQTPIKISFNVNMKILGKLERYIDLNNSSRQQDSVKCPNALIQLGDNDRIVCLNRPKCECYFLTISSNLVTIRGLFVPEVNDRSWLLFQGLIPDVELDSAQARFKREILDKL